MTSTGGGGRVSVSGVVHQNVFVPVGGTVMRAVLYLDTETAGLTVRSGREDQAEVVVIDVSGSMAGGGRIERAVAAAGAAIRQVPDGVAFAVVVGNQKARMLWPPERGLRTADDRSREEAVAALGGLVPAGGTAIGSWLLLARELVRHHPGSLRHVTLISDGRNEHETQQRLDDAITACVGELRCDTRGIGVADFFTSLYRVAERLSGSYGAVADPADLESDFTGVMNRALDAQLELELEVAVTAGVTVRSVRQVEPMIADLDRVGTDDGAGRYLLGTWGGEGSAKRIYELHLDMRCPPLSGAARVLDSGTRVLAERLLARVRVRSKEPLPAGAELLQTYHHVDPDGAEVDRDRGRILAVWTDDPAAPLVPNEHVAAVGDNVGLAEDLRAGLAAYRDGRIDEANDRLRAVHRRAVELDDRSLCERLDAVYDEHSDTFRLGGRDQVELEEVSTRTSLLDR